MVRGGYSLLEPDGTTRLVEYIADDDGFRAVVNKLGTAIHSIAPIVPQYGTYSGQYNNYYAQAVPQVPVSILPDIKSSLISTKSLVPHSTPIVSEYQQNLNVPIASQYPIPVQANIVPVQTESFITQSASPGQIVPQTNYEASGIQEVPQTYSINQQILTSARPQYEQQVSPQPADYVAPQLELKQRFSIPQAPGLVGQPILSNSNTAQYQYEVRPSDNAVYSDNSAVALNGLSPISPSYTTNIQFDGYSGAYSQAVPNLLPAPITKPIANLKPELPTNPRGKFLIYVPESESA